MELLGRSHKLTFQKQGHHGSAAGDTGVYGLLIFAARRM
jgi:hypothetical protein